ncbi:MAG: hypothetical protein KGZ37_09225 [Nitrosarchaeum sp.]|nr:hypothetical protein [Nitrosarchaeum sp.]
MTCIIGATCIEGAVIISDTRILRGYQSSNESKFHFVFDKKVVVAGAGATATVDYLEDDLKQYEQSTVGESNEVIKKIEDSLTNVKTRYFARMGTDFEIDAIVGGIDCFETGNPYLRVVYANAVSEKIRNFHIIGHGAPYATTLFSLMYDYKLTINELAILGFFTISALERLGIDQSVGNNDNGPEIVVIKPNEKPERYDTTGDEFIHTRDWTANLEFKEKLIESIWKTRPTIFK